MVCYDFTGVDELFTLSNIQYQIQGVQPEKLKGKKFHDSLSSKLIQNIITLRSAVPFSTAAIASFIWSSL